MKSMFYLLSQLQAMPSVGLTVDTRLDRRTHCYRFDYLWLQTTQPAPQSLSASKQFMARSEVDSDAFGFVQVTRAASKLSTISMYIVAIYYYSSM